MVDSPDLFHSWIVLFQWICSPGEKNLCFHWKHRTSSSSALVSSRCRMVNCSYKPIIKASSMISRRTRRRFYRIYQMVYVPVTLMMARQLSCLSTLLTTLRKYSSVEDPTRVILLHSTNSPLRILHRISAADLLSLQKGLSVVGRLKGCWKVGYWMRWY